MRDYLRYALRGVPTPATRLFYQKARFLGSNPAAARRVRPPDGSAGAGKAGGCDRFHPAPNAACGRNQSSPLPSGERGAPEACSHRARKFRWKTLCRPPAAGCTVGPRVVGWCFVTGHCPGSHFGNRSRFFAPASVGTPYPLDRAMTSNEHESPRYASGRARLAVVVAGIATCLGAYLMFEIGESLLSDYSISGGVSPWADVMHIGAAIGFPLGVSLLGLSAFLPGKGTLLRGRANRKRIALRFSLRSLFRATTTFFVWLVAMSYVWSLELPDFHPNILIFGLSWPFTGVCVGMRFLYLFHSSEDDVGHVLILLGVGTLLGIFVVPYLCDVFGWDTDRGISRHVLTGMSYLVTAAVSCADVLWAFFWGVPQAGAEEAPLR